MLPSDSPMLVEKNANHGQCGSQPAPNRIVDTTSKSTYGGRMRRTRRA